MIKKHIPNFITCCNLTCGCVGLVIAFQGELKLSVYLIWAAMVFDFFDGFAARLLKVSSAIGKELDSLADMVSFGVLPAAIVFQLIGSAESLAYAAFSIAIFSALRLAKFNIDEDQATDFIGLPTPANALFLSSLVFMINDPFGESLLTTGPLVGISIIFSLLLVAPIRLFSLKFKNILWRDNKIRIIFLALALVFIALLGIKGLPIIIITYIILGVLQHIIQLQKQ